MKIIGDDAQHVNRFCDQNPAVYAGFSSLGAMTDYLATIPKHMHGEGHDKSMPDWYGSRDMPHALQIARDGWPEGVQKAQEVADQISTAATRSKRRTRAVAGGSVSIGRLLSGNPKCMTTRRRVTGRKVVTMFVGTGNAALVPARAMIARAAAIAAICNVAEIAGYSCEIVMIGNQSRSLTSRNQSMLQTVVTVKHAGERFNLSDMVFALGHPSYFRRFTFAICSAQNECKSIWHTQGYAGEMFTDDWTPAPGEIHIPFLSIEAWRNMREKQDVFKMAMEMIHKNDFFGLTMTDN